MKRLNAGWTAAAVLVAGAFVAGGCSSSGGHSTADAVGNRPVVEQTAVEAAVHDEGAALAFFDTLEAQPLASQDDAINACLLLGTGSTAPTYEQRLAMATRLGYVPKGYDRPARQAVTMGEISTMSIKLLEGRMLSQEDALQKLVQRGIAPASARYNQGLTGAQLVSITGGVRDAMRIEGVQRVAAPAVPEPVKVAPAPMTANVDKTPAAAPVPPEAAISTGGVALNEASKDQGRSGVSAAAKGAPASAHEMAPAGAAVSTMPGNPKAHSEPLPKIPVGTVPPAIDLQDPKAKPSVIGPDDKVITPGQPKSNTKPVPAPAAPVAQPDPKPAPGAEPKQQVQAQPAGTPTMEPVTNGTQASGKKPGAKVWVVGQPLKKTASAEETK